jgi:enterochelin esterase family protein
MPIVEEAPGAPDRRLVTFVWKGDATTRRVTLFGGRPAADYDKPLSRLGASDLWFRTELLPSDARFQYWFRVDGPEELGDRIEEIFDGPAPVGDPLNPKALDGEAYVVLPDAPPFPYPPNPGAPPGTIVESSLASPTLGATIALTVYRPAASKGGEKPWLAVLFDGGFLEMKSVLDDRIARGQLPPLVVVGVHNREGMRPKDLGYSEPFARFVAEELVPWASREFGADPSRERTIVGGVSRGAGQAAFVGLRHPARFSRVLCISTAIENEPGDFPPTRFWLRGDDGWIVERFVESPLLPLRFFVAAGRFDTSLWTDRLVNARRFRDALRAKGYRVDGFEAHAGHDQLFFQLAFDEGLRAVTRDAR